MTVSFHVATTGTDDTDGSENQPFRTINRAAALARPGDTVLVHGGEYREWVQPRRGGLSDRRRITYTAAPGEHVVIKGSEPVTGWDRVSGDVWTVAVPNALFGTFNPFAEEIDGDWIVYADASTPKKHLGDVYLNGTSFYEVAGVDEVSEPPLRTEMTDNWTGTVDRIRDTKQTQLVWYAEVGADQTTVWANFGGVDPNDELVEINVRRSVFYPTEHHLDYITVRGFELRPGRQPVGAADRRPARSDRPELGQGLDHRRQRHPRRKVLSGLHRQRGVHRPQLRHPAPRQARLPVPTRVGVRRPPDRLGPGAHRLPHDPPQHHLRLRPERHRRSPRLCVLHHRGQPHLQHRDQARVLRLRDRRHQAPRRPRCDHPPQPHPRLHARHLAGLADPGHPGVAEPVLLQQPRPVRRGQPRAVPGRPQRLGVPGLARGVQPGWGFRQQPGLRHGLPRAGRGPAHPYHVPHSTQVAGYAAILGGDDRYIGNIFLGGDPTLAYGRPSQTNRPAHYGTDGYDGHPPSLEAYLALVADPTRGDHERFKNVKQPVFIRDNVYAAGAKAFEAEQGATVLAGDDITASVVEEGAEVYLECQLPADFDNVRVDSVSGADLERVRFVDADFEEPDGSPVVLGADLVGADKLPANAYPPGPVSALSSGSSRIRVW